MLSINPDPNNEVSLCVLHKHAKLACEKLAKHHSNEPRAISSSELNRIPFKQIYVAFKKNNAHEITKNIIKIAHQLAQKGLFSDAVELLVRAEKSPLRNEKYRNHFFSHKSCLESLNKAKAKIFYTYESSLDEEKRCEKETKLNKEIYGAYARYK